MVEKKKEKSPTKTLEKAQKKRKKSEKEVSKKIAKKKISKKEKVVKEKKVKEKKEKKEVKEKKKVIPGRYEISDIKEGLKIANSKELNEVYSAFSKDFDKELNFSGIYLSEKEVELEIISRITEFMLSEYNDLKNKISLLRKNGDDINVIDYKIMMFPLKIKILLSEFSLENYNYSKKILFSCKKELDGYSLD
jgi:hypothetical protein